MNALVMRKACQLVTFIHATSPTLTGSCEHLCLMIIKQTLHRLDLSSSGTQHSFSSCTGACTRTKILCLLNSKFCFPGGKSCVLNVQTRTGSKFRCFSLHGPPETPKPHESVGSLDAPATQPLNADRSLPVSFGKQRRRRGLPAIDRTSPPNQGSRSGNESQAGSPNSTDRSLRPQESKNGSLPLSCNAQQDTVAMLPHLSASIGRSPPRQHGSVFGPRVSVNEQGEDGSKPSSGADDRRRSHQEASPSAADVSDIGDRAEGILRIGASGAQIPLYGRCASLKSIVRGLRFFLPCNPQWILSNLI